MYISTHLFDKVPRPGDKVPRHRPGDSEGTFSVFEFSCHLLLLY